MALDPLMLAALLAAALYLVLGIVFLFLSARTKRKKGGPNNASSMLNVFGVLMLFLTVAFPLFCWLFLQFGVA